jgi:hypothetical protein
MGWAEDNERERMRRMAREFYDRNNTNRPDVEEHPFPAIEQTTQTAMSEIAMRLREAIGPALEAGRSLEAALIESGYTGANAENIATEYIVVCVSHFRKG